VTHRGVASSFAVVTATLEGGTDNELGRVAAAVDTLVVLMAAGRMERLCQALVRAGRDPDDPAAAIQWATTSEQRTVGGTLTTLPALAREAGMGAPATLVIGPVVDLAFVLAAGSVHAGGEALPDRRSSQRNDAPLVREG
jgi:siroheme synthase